LAAVSTASDPPEPKRDGRDPLGEFDRRACGVVDEGVEGGQFPPLLGHGIDDLVTAVTDVHVPERGSGVEVSIPVFIEDVDAFAAVDDEWTVLDLGHLGEGVPVSRHGREGSGDRIPSVPPAADCAGMLAAHALTAAVPAEASLCVRRKAMALPAVELVGVSKKFGDVVAVDGVDLTVEDGEFFSLLGPSGCGKTTTLRMIAGFEYPTSGSLRIHGEEMGLRPPNERPVNTVFQSYALFPHMTVAENVAFGLEMKKVAKNEIAEKVRRVLDQVQLGTRADANPSQLSGGMQQRVALARALVNEPEVLLLDEPLGALDLKLRQAMQVELKELQARVGITFIYVTHDQEEALTMSDRIGVVNEGVLLQVGPSEEIYERPTSRFVADFIGDINLLDVTVTGPRTARLGNGTEIGVPDTGARGGSDLTLALRPEQLALYDLDEEIPSGHNRVRVHVARRLYHGDVYYYDVDAGLGTGIEVKEENRPGVERYEVGEEAFLVWSAEAANLVTG
jgi:spermidine/putrescine transport system ATP-binding protein